MVSRNRLLTGVPEMRRRRTDVDTWRSGTPSPPPDLRLSVLYGTCVDRLVTVGISSDVSGARRKVDGDFCLPIHPTSNPSSSTPDVFLGKRLPSITPLLPDTTGGRRLPFLLFTRIPGPDTHSVYTRGFPDPILTLWGNYVNEGSVRRQKGIHFTLVVVEEKSWRNTLFSLLHISHETSRWPCPDVGMYSHQHNFPFTFPVVFVLFGFGLGLFVSFMLFPFLCPFFFPSTNCELCRQYPLYSGHKYKERFTTDVDKVPSPVPQYVCKMNSQVRSEERRDGWDTGTITEPS